jgi:hypothetical protein
MNFISFENRRNCIPTIYARQFVFISVDVDVRPFLACMTSAPGAALQRTTKVLLKRPYLHAAGTSLHQPKYSLKRCNLHVAFALRIMGVDVHPFFPRISVTRQTSRRPHRAPNHQPKYSSNGPIFMQLTPRSTNQSTLLNVSILTLHSLFTSWASMSILSFVPCIWTIQTSRPPYRAPSSNQSTPQTALSSCSSSMVPLSTNQSTPLNGAIFMLHSLFTHHGRRSSSLLFSHAYDKQLTPPARFTSHQLSTPSTALYMMYARKERMGIDALFVLSWHHGTGTCSSLFSWKGFTKLYLNSFFLEPICDYIYIWLLTL